MSGVVMHRHGDGQYVFNVGDEKYLATRTTWESAAIWDVCRFADGMVGRHFTTLREVREWATRNARTVPAVTGEPAGASSATRDREAPKDPVI